MTKYEATIVAPRDPDFADKTYGNPGKPVPIETLGELETMIAKAKLTGAPPAARFRLIMTMGGKVKAVVLRWED